MFPHTQHCEVIIELVRQEAKMPTSEESVVVPITDPEIPNAEESKE
jgi:hypothetical protein